MKNIQVGIIIVNWNGLEDTKLLIDSIGKLETSIPYHIYLIDNASSDRPNENFKTKNLITFIQLEENKGFTGANNIGIQAALKDGNEYLWILNNDTVVDPYALDTLIEPFKFNDTGITVSKIYFMKGREYHHDRYSEEEKGNVLWYAGGKIDWENMYGSHRGVDEVDKGQYDSVEETMFATGCSLMTSRKVITDVGMFNEQYFAYLEDMDFSMRVKKKGYKILYIPQSKIWHKNAGSTSAPGNDIHQYYMTRNRLLFGMRYASLRTKIALLREARRFFVKGTVTQKQAVSDWFQRKLGKRV